MCGAAGQLNGCTSLSTDPNNCGQCGVACPTGACAATDGGTPSDGGAARISGRCTCATSGDCPRPDSSGSRQSCGGTSQLCGCSDNDQCAYKEGGRCSSSGSICYYP